MISQNYLIIFLFVLSLLMLLKSGPRLTFISIALAKKTGWGEAFFGAVFVGIITSLSGSIVSVLSASYGLAELAISNAIGGICAQTVFLAVADMFYRKTNLEHAAASQENLIQASILIIFLTLPLLAKFSDQLTIFQIHPISFLMIALYFLSLRLIHHFHKFPMWSPNFRKETFSQDGIQKKDRISKWDDKKLWINFIIHAFCVAFSGWLLSKVGMNLSQEAGVSETVVGGLVTAITTSLPELIVAIAAVRQGALSLAVGDILGGNIFDTLIMAFSDFAYREGSVYQETTSQQQFLVYLGILLTAILLTGLINREKHGIANIGFESFMIFIIYIAGIIVMTSLA